MTQDIKLPTLTGDEIEVLRLYREALAKSYAELTVSVHNGKMVSASLEAKFKY